MEEKLKQLHALGRATLFEAREMEALLNYKDENVLVNNFSRLIGDINNITANLKEIKELAEEIGLPNGFCR